MKIARIFVTIIFICKPSYAAIALVQTKGSSADTPAARITTTFDASPTEGNLMVATLSSNDGDMTNPSGWTTAVNNVNTTHDDFLRIAYKVAAAGESASITFTDMAGGGSANLGLYEFSGVDTASPLDDTGSTAFLLSRTDLGADNTVPLVTTVPDTVLVALLAVRADITSPAMSNTFTLTHDLKPTASFEGVDGYRIVSSQGLNSTTFTWTNSGTALAAIAAFEASAGAVAPALAPQRRAFWIRR